ncbi:MAG: SDR family oxidoreductase [Pseudomonadota bacterium]
MDISQSTIAITGAAGGLGSAMAQRLAGQGAQLALIDLDKSALEPVRAACIDAGAGAALAYAANVTDEADTSGVFAAIAADFGALHGVVNNAGITRDALTVKFRDGECVSAMTLDQWQSVLDANLTGVFLCGREASRHMITLGCHGCVINISSISRAGNMGQINYSATKAGVEAMAVVWAREWARYGIRAASIAPGFIGTDMVRSMKPEALKKLSAMIPVQRMGEPDEIARAVAFIFENDYFNGRCLELDGGLRL